MRSRREDGSAGGTAAVQSFVRFAGIRELEALVDRDLHRAGGDDRKQIVGGVLKLLRGARVVAERWAREIERALCRQDARLERRDRAGRVAEADQESPHGERI